MKNNIKFFVLTLTLSFLNLEIRASEDISSSIPGSKALENKVEDLMEKTYSLWNQLIDPSNPLDFTELKNIIEPDFSWKTHNTIWAIDYNSLCERIKYIRNRDFVIQVDLPFKDIIVSKDNKKCVVTYTLSKKFKDNSLQKESVVAIFYISEEGKLKKVEDVSYIISK